MSTIAIPATVDSAVDMLAGVDRLLRAKEWERSAIVYAFTQEGVGQGERTDLGGNSPKLPLSFKGFAALGIAGLRDHHTVARYHRAWASLVESEDVKPVYPGETVTLPDLPWPQDAKVQELGEARRADVERISAKTGVGANKIADVMNNPAAVEAAVEADPALAARIVSKAISNPEVAAASLTNPKDAAAFNEGQRIVDERNTLERHVRHEKFLPGTDPDALRAVEAGSRLTTLITRFNFEASKQLEAILDKNYDVPENVKSEIAADLDQMEVVIDFLRSWSRGKSNFDQALADFMKDAS